MPNLRLVVLFVEYDNGKYPRAFQRFRHLVDKIENVDKTYYIIDNRNEGDYLQPVSEGVHRVGGDNSNWEFSGWQRGLDVLHRECVEYDAILFANDAFMAYGWSFLETHANTKLVEHAIRHKAAIGQIDTKGIPLDAFGKDVSSWICTNCFLLPKVLVQSLQSIVSIDEKGIDEVLGKDYWEFLALEKRITAKDLNRGSFEIVCDIRSGSAFRLVADKSFVPDGGQDTRELCLMVTKLVCGEVPFDGRAITIGFYDNEGHARWIRSAARIEFLEEAKSPLRISAYVPMDVLENKYGGELLLKVFQTAPLFRRDAPVGASYRQMVVDWLTQEWHSKLEINQGNWERFRNKAKAMLNESLLTARIRDKGFRVESYKQCGLET